MCLSFLDALDALLFHIFVMYCHYRREVVSFLSYEIAQHGVDDVLTLDGAKKLFSQGPAQSAISCNAEGAGEREKGKRLQTPLDLLRLS